ncbi:DUF6941 family protein [Gordonia phosphorivorans]|uniref:DUF6941 family protein n=1 Tax=Gordonia phosphorivorans TaxID=1056982 RepID=A0ABV6H6G5_9ACTN
MPELDYAFLADYATITDGKITAVGASFIDMKVPSTPFAVSLCVAGRVRADEGFAPFDMALSFDLPGDSPVFTINGTIDSSMTDHVYDGKSAVLFCISQPLAILEPGLVTLTITLNEDVVRVLKFEVITD